MSRIVQRLLPCLLILFCFPVDVLAEKGEVTLPLSQWEAMQHELEASKEKSPPPNAYSPLERSIEGEFRKGLFRGTLNARFEVLDDRGHIRVPVLDAQASLGEVKLNGQRTSLLREDDLYTLGIDRPGSYTLTLEFFWGREQLRFARRLAFNLPEGGVTRMSIRVPEQEIEATLSHGALTSQRQNAQGTVLEGYLDASGVLDLSWTRRLTHREKKQVRLEAQVNTLLTMHEALVSGLAVFDFAVLEGETDRVDLRLPPDIEVVNVEGDAVLQWRTDASEGEQLTVLLRYLVEDQARVAVHFQYPVLEGQEIDLRMPFPDPDTPMEGSVGVQGPAGLKVEVVAHEAATKLELRDLPGALTELTSSPLLFGFRFTEPPKIRLTLTRHNEVPLTSTLIDELQASSVLIEDGTEATKLKYRIRNNTRQYLRLVLPEGAVLTQSQIDGRPVRPAIAGDGSGRELLFPLQQSERVGATGERFHVVREGETLSEIANFYYSDPSQWRNILEGNNDQLYDASDVTPGQRLRIPTPRGVVVEESSFVVELAYKRTHSSRLGTIGRCRLDLPEVDVEVMKAIWHLYFPEAFTPLSFDANLTQFSAIRYDLFRRARDFFHRAMWGQRAWAGERYYNILSQRKEIYKADYGRKASAETVLATFPLVGDQYRFKRTLLGTEAPYIRVTYVADWVNSAARWTAFLSAMALGFFLFRRTRSLLPWLAAAGFLAFGLWAAHYFLGVHRRIVWGLDIALVLTLLWHLSRPIWEGLKGLIRSPWTLVGLITLRNIALAIGLVIVFSMVLAFPMFLSTITLAVLALVWRRTVRGSVKEVAHDQES